MPIHWKTINNDTQFTKLTQETYNQVKVTYKDSHELQFKRVDDRFMILFYEASRYYLLKRKDSIRIANKVDILCVLPSTNPLDFS